MKELVFEEYSAEYEDSDGDKHTQTVRACVLDKDTYSLGKDANGQAIPREFTVVGRSDRMRATPGMVVVETDKPGEYDIHSTDTWKEMGFKATKSGGTAK